MQCDVRKGVNNTNTDCSTRVHVSCRKLHCGELATSHSQSGNGIIGQNSVSTLSWSCLLGKNGAKYFPSALISEV